MMWRCAFVFSFFLLYLFGRPVNSTTLSAVLASQTMYNISMFLAIPETKRVLNTGVTVFVVPNSGMPRLNTTAQRNQLAMNLIMPIINDIKNGSNSGEDYGFGMFRKLYPGTSNTGAAIFRFIKGNNVYINAERVLTESQNPRRLVTLRATSPETGVAYFLSKTALPLGIGKPFYNFNGSANSSFLYSNVMWRMMYNFTKQYFFQISVRGNSRFEETLKTGTATYFITSNAGWNRVFKYTGTTKLQRIDLIIRRHFITNTPYFIRFVPGVIPPSYPINAHDYVVFRNRNGADYLVAKGVKSKFLEKNYVIINGVSHVIDWPVDFRFGTFTETLNTFAKIFLSRCQALNQSSTNCNSKLSPTSLKNTVLAPETFKVKMTISNTELMEIMDLHFLNALLTEYNMEAVSLNPKNYTALFNNTIETIRVNYDSTNRILLEVRPLTNRLKMMGYISAVLTTSDIPREKGNIQVVSRPFGVYDYDILSYLKTRPDLYSTFLKLNNDRLLPLTDTSMNMTVLIPTNAAFAIMNRSTVDKGKAILANSMATANVFKRFVIPNQRLMIEDWPVGSCRNVSTLNTPTDMIQLSLCAMIINSNPHFTVAIDRSKSQGKLSLGGIGASNGIIYPADAVLYQSTDADAVLYQTTTISGSRNGNSRNAGHQITIDKWFLTFVTTILCWTVQPTQFHY